MFNPFILRKYTALIFSSLITVVCFYIGLIFYKNLWIAIGFMLGGALIGVLLAVLLLKNPFSDLLEGKGILAIDVNSTGILKPFIVKVFPPYIHGKNGSEKVNDVFDRSTVMQLAKPVKGFAKMEYIADKKIKIEIDEDKYNSSRFALNQYPVLLYNAQIKSLLTKDLVINLLSKERLSEMEKDAFAEHGILYLNRKMEELTSHIRDFGRHVVETLKPKDSFMGNKWVMIIVIILIGLLIALFLPKIIATFKGGAGGALTSAFSTAKSATSIITPQ